jgi:hypothetical protein
MKRASLFLIVSVLLLAAGCEKDANVKLPEVEPKLVVTSFLSPQDTLIKVWIKKTRPIFESYDVNTSDAVADATVIISDGTASATLAFDPTGSNNGYYKIPAAVFPIVENKTYSLSVSTPDGKSASAVTTVPSFSIVTFNANISYVTLDSTATNYKRQYDIVCSWDDVPGSGSKYRIVVMKAEYDHFLGDTLYYVFMDDFVNDEGKEGTRMEFKYQRTAYYYDYASANTNLIGYNIYLYQINDEYLKYHKTVRSSGDDPFSEPVLVYSNITGGLGVFSAYNELGKIIIR